MYRNSMTHRNLLGSIKTVSTTLHEAINTFMDELTEML